MYPKIRITKWRLINILTVVSVAGEMASRKRQDSEFYFDPDSGNFIRRTKYYKLKYSAQELQVSFQIRVLQYVAPFLFVFNLQYVKFAVYNLMNVLYLTMRCMNCVQVSPNVSDDEEDIDE